MHEPMPRRRVSRLLAAGIVCSLLAASCSSSQSDDRPVIEVFGSYRGADAANFAASFKPFEDEHGYDVRYVGTGSFSQDIQDRITEAQYPDVAIFPQPALILDAVAKGALARLPDSIAVGTDHSGDEVLESFSVWFRANAKSLVWYRPDVFEENGYDTPQTWGELMELSDRMVADGVAPWCLSIESFSSTGWVGTDWIEDIILREQGKTFYDAWVAGDILFDSAEVRHAFGTFDPVVHGVGTVLGGTNRILNTPWEDAASPMFENPSLCMMHRQVSSWSPNIPEEMAFPEDINFFVLPGLTDSPAPVLVGGELAAAFNDRPEVAAFMEYLATPAAGEGWAKLGGFVSPHEDFDASHYGSSIDKIVSQVIRDAPYVRFDGSDTMPAVVGTGTFWQAMRIYISSGDINQAVTLIDDSWPRISQLPDTPDG